MADQTVLDRLPSLEDVEREIARKTREQRFLRSIREALKRKRDCDRVAEKFERADIATPRTKQMRVEDSRQAASKDDEV